MPPGQGWARFAFTSWKALGWVDASLAACGRRGWFYNVMITVTVLTSGFTGLTFTHPRISAVRNRGCAGQGRRARADRRHCIADTAAARPAWRSGRRGWWRPFALRRRAAGKLGELCPNVGCRNMITDEALQAGQSTRGLAPGQATGRSGAHDATCSIGTERTSCAS